MPAERILPQGRNRHETRTRACAAVVLAGAALAAAAGSRVADEKAVADLDTQYQAAVEKNDAETMAGILLDDFVLVVGNGTAYTKQDLLKSARAKDDAWEHQVDRDAERPRPRRHRRRHGQAVAEGNERRPADRQEALVQRHLRSHGEGLALLLRPGLAQPAARALSDRGGRMFTKLKHFERA